MRPGTDEFYKVCVSVITRTIPLAPSRASIQGVDIVIRLFSRMYLIDFIGDLPAEGFEPPTYGLQNRCTTTVLSRRGLAL
jgi:hypothetical protein